MKKLILLCSPLMLVGLLVGPASATVHNVEVADFAFSPANLTIAPGDTVVWTNILGFHSVHHTGTPSLFGNAPAPAPWVYEHDFATEPPGVYPYICEVHPTMMQGTITITDVPCDAPAPPDVILSGTSACIQVCPNDFIIIELQGDLDGPGAVPVILLEAGCMTLNCEVECIAIDPPESLELGANPFYPDDYYGASDCLEIFMHWVHDGVWTFEVFSDCEGCFCVTFDRQLAAELLSFTAIPRDHEIELRWTTASEVDNDYFEILREDIKVGEVDAAVSPSGAHYAWADRGLENGVPHRYTLMAVGVSGVREAIGSLSETAGVNVTVVSEYALHQNYPNPFNPRTSIVFDLPEAGVVTLGIYDVMGRSVTTLVNGSMESGQHVVSFDAGNLSSGMYLYRLEANGFETQKKMLLLK